MAEREVKMEIRENLWGFKGEVEVTKREVKMEIRKRNRWKTGDKGE